MTADMPLAVRSREVALVDLLDRVLAGGVVVAGDITIAIADVDLVRISLRALVCSAATAVAELGEGRASRPGAASTASASDSTASAWSAALPGAGRA